MKTDLILLLVPVQLPNLKFRLELRSFEDACNQKFGYLYSVKKKFGYLSTVPIHAVIIITTVEGNLLLFCVLDMLLRMDSMTSWNTCTSLPVYTINIQRSFTAPSELLLKNDEICANSKRKYPSGASAVGSKEDNVRDCARIRSASSTLITRRRKRKHPQKRQPVHSFKLSQKRSDVNDSTEGLNSFASCWTAFWRLCFKN